MFFDIFSALCQKKGVSRYKACTDIGLNRAAVAKWKSGAIPTGTTIAKMADYFDVTTDYLLGADIQAQIDGTFFKIKEMEHKLDKAGAPEEKDAIEASLEALKESYQDLRFAKALLPSPEKKEAPAGERELSEDDVKLALFGGDAEVSDAMWEEAKNFIAYLKERERKKKE